MSQQAQNRICKSKKKFLTSLGYFLIGQGPDLVTAQALAAACFAATRFPLKPEYSPRHADYLIVAGPVNRRYRLVIKRLAAQLAHPGRVVLLEKLSPTTLTKITFTADPALPPTKEASSQINSHFQARTEAVTGFDPPGLIRTLHNNLALSSSYKDDLECGPGTLVPLRPSEEKELATEDLTLSLGPAHPAVYGPLRLVLTLDGEQVVEAAADPGFAHRGLEKRAEGHEPFSALSFGAALDALAPLAGTMAVARALEKMVGEGSVPVRAGFVRLIVLELERIASHLFAQATVLKTLALDGPAHKVLNMFVEVASSLRLVCGATPAPFIVPGGVQTDLNPLTLTNLTSLVRQVQTWVRQELGPPTHSLANKMFKYGLGSRLKGFGVIPLEEAVALGFTGPNLRASGPSFDWRALSSPASSGLPYSDLGFMPIISSSSSGDAYSRYQLRLEEIAASSALVELALKNLPAGPYQLDLDLDKAFLPSNFEGSLLGPAEAGGIVESPRGLMEARLGLTLSLTGKMVIERLHFRSPSWSHFQALPRLVTGARLPDALVIINSLDIAPDEAER